MPAPPDGTVVGPIAVQVNVGPYFITLHQQADGGVLAYCSACKHARLVGADIINMKRRPEGGLKFEHADDCGLQGLLKDETLRQLPAQGQVC